MVIAYFFVRLSIVEAQKNKLLKLRVGSNECISTSLNVTVIQVLPLKLMSNIT
jgi:hypothetical protein